MLPYRGLHTDLVAHERYYTFDEPSTADPVDMTAWTAGADADVLESLTQFDGSNTSLLSADALSANVYIQSSVTGLDTALPCTFRVTVQSLQPAPELFAASSWLRIYDPTDANTDVWIHLTNTLDAPDYPDMSTATYTSTGVIGNVGTDVIEARVVNPIPGMTNLRGFEEVRGGAGDANGFMVLEFELPAAASRTIRIQRVTSNGATTLGAGTDAALIARAEVLQGKVSRWTCRHTGRTFSQPTASLQPYARPMGVPAHNGRRVLNFNGGKYLKSDDATTEWTFISSGAECSVYAAVSLTADSSGYALSTHGSSPTTDGWSLSYDPTTNEAAIQAFNAAAATVLNIRATVALNTLYVLGYRALDGHADGDAVVEIAGGEVVGNASNWGAGAPPAHTLYIGGRPPGAVAWDGYIGDVVIYNVRLDDDEHARALEELESWNAGAASIPGCIAALAADYGALGDPVTEWSSHLGNDQSFVGSGGISAPASSVAFRGAMRMALTEAQAFVDGSSLITNLNADHAVICCAQLLSDTTGEDILWEFRNGGTNTYESLGYAAGQWVYTRRAQGGSTDAVSVGTANFLPHVHSFRVASGNRSAWVDGTSLFADVASNPGTMTGVELTILGSGDAADSGAPLNVGEFAVYNAAPDDYQRQLVERAMRRRMLGLDRLGDGQMKLGMGVGLGYSLGTITDPPVVDTDRVVLTRFSTLSGNFPSTPGVARVRGCGGGGGGVAATSTGGSGATAELTAYPYAANEAFTLSIGAAGPAAGGTGGDTTFNTTAMVAKGAVGRIGGLAASCVGDVIRAGIDGALTTGTGAPSNGWNTAAVGATPGEPSGVPGGNATVGTARIPGAGGGSDGTVGRIAAAGLGVLEYTELSGGVYPDHVDYRVTRTVGTNHVVDIPPGNVGDLLLYIVGSDGNPTITCGSDSSVCASTSGTTVTGNAFWRVATGTDTTTITTTASEEVTTTVIRFRHAGTPTGTATNATGANANPPIHTPPGGSAPYRWLTVAICNSGSNADGQITARPTNYDKSIYTPVHVLAGGIAMIVCWRDNTAVSEDPGAFTSTGDNVTMTIAVPRAA